MIGRLLILLLLALFAVLQQRLWLGSGGLTELRHLRQTEQQQQQRLHKLKERNAHMAAEVRELKTGLEAVEAHARGRLGLIREGEVYYQVPDPEPGASPD